MSVRQVAVATGPFERADKGAARVPPHLAYDSRAVLTLVFRARSLQHLRA